MVEATTRRITTPTILQMEAAECGAAALAIILAYYGRYESLEKIRVECGVSRDGSKAINILKVARLYGLKAEGAQIDDLTELKGLTLPVILFWKFNHFVVLEGWGPGQFYINDPASGPRVVDEQEFDRSFTGVLLIFEPTQNFEKKGEPPSLIQALKERLTGSSPAVLFIILASLLLVIPGIIIPGFSKIFIDDILIQNKHDWFALLLLGMIITASLRGLITALQQKFLLRLQVKLMLTSSARFFWHVLHLPITFFHQRYAGDIQERIAANSRIANLLAGNLSSSVASLITILFFALVMLFLSWSLTLIGLVAVLLNFTLLYALSRKMRDTSKRFLQERGRLTGIEMSGLQNIETFKAMARENDFFIRWAGAHAKMINSQQDLLVYEQLLLIIPSLLSGLTTVAILGLGSLQIIHGQLTVGTLVAFQSLMASFYSPVISLLGLGNHIQQIGGDLARLNDVLEHPEDVRFTIPEKKEAPLSGQIELKNITFGYSPLDPPFINNLNLHIKINTHVALIGKSGSGKSTLAKLICGLYQPRNGEIIFADHLLKHISQETLAKFLSLVDTDFFLFEGTIRENLTLWNSELSDDILWQALQDACIDDVVRERGGLDANMVEGGTNFSGGQRQRFDIARALASNPRYLILDEATASLDPIMEQTIHHHIKKRNCTLIIVSHRLSTIRDCDEIVIMDQGKIINRGTHDQLIQSDKLYQELVVWE